MTTAQIESARRSVLGSARGRIVAGGVIIEPGDRRSVAHDDSGPIEPEFASALMDRLFAMGLRLARCGYTPEPGIEAVADQLQFLIDEIRAAVAVHSPDD